MKNYLFTAILCTLITTLTCLAQYIRAQELINEVFIADSALTAEQLTRKSLFIAESRTRELKIVTIEDILERQVGNLVSVVLPDRSDEFFFQGQYIEFIDSSQHNQYNWSGELVINHNGFAEMDSMTDGRLLLFYRQDRIFGQLILDTLVYVIRDLTGGLNALILQNAIDSLAPPDCNMEDSSVDTSDFSNDQIITNRDLTICPVSILVCYTETVLEKAPDIIDIAEIGRFLTNSIVRKSNVGPNYLFFYTKGYHEIPKSEWEETPDPQDVDNIVGILSVQNLRTSLKADIVVVLTDNIHVDYGGAVARFGFENGSGEDSAYALVEYDIIAGDQYTFPHEIYHLFNARHELKEVCGNGNDNGNPFAHGWLINPKNDGNSKPCSRKTVMAICTREVERLEHLSNPNIKYKKWKTGHSDKADNARQVNLNACMVSDYFPSDEIPIANIIAMTVGCHEQLFQLSGNIEGPIPTPHEFIWRYSTDGSNWSAPSSNMVQFEIYLNYPLGTVLFFELKAGHEGGPWSYAYHSVTVIENSPNCYRNPTTSDNQEIMTKNEMYSIVPNPASDYFKIVSIDYLSHDIEIRVFDLVNRTCLYLDSCTNECMIPTSSLSNGMYLVVIKNKSGDHVCVQKFSVMR